MRLAGRLILMAIAGMMLIGLAKNPREMITFAQSFAATREGGATPNEAISKEIKAEAAIIENASKEKQSHTKTKTGRKKRARHARVVEKKVIETDCSAPGPTGKKRSHIADKRCEPQSLIYARQRSGNMSSRTGRENGPLTWFNSEKKLGRTSDEPLAGSVLILSANRRHGMPTGHVAYVESVSPEDSSTYRLIFSHTNYDRRCSLETNIEAVFNRDSMTLDIFSGAWRVWGRGLKVAGFIHG